MSPRPEQAITADVHNLLGHRCGGVCGEGPTCRLEADAAAEYSVVFRVDDTGPLAIGVFGMSMCNDCVTDTRAALPDDIERIATVRRAKR